MPGLESPLTRRATLLTGSASVAVTLAACRSGTSTASTAPGDPSPAPTVDPDAGLVRRAHDGEDQLRRDALRTSQRHPALRPALRRAAEVHAVHADLLRESLDIAGGDPVGRQVPRDPQAAARGLARRERALAEAHARAALDARSGPLARVLAGMAAAADQQALVLDELAVTGRRRG
jgi:hypothetical protein